MSSAAEFLFVQAAGVDDSHQAIEAIVGAVARAGGTLMAAQAEGEVEQLEPGTPSGAIVLARWRSRAELDAGWQHAIADAVDSVDASPMLALAVGGLPDEGLPDQLEIPTVASVPRIPDRAPPTYMTIQGTAHDPERIAAYRDVILPMLKQLGAYYIVFAVQEGAVRVLRGSWQEQILAVSAWPTHQAAHDFWFSERYQTVAKPIRTGSSSFHVHLLDGTLRE